MTSEQLAAARRLLVFLTALAGLLTAIFKPQSHEVAKVSYDELSAGIEKLNVAVAQNHDDVVMLRGYVAKMDGERLMQSTVFTVAVDASAVVPAPGAGVGAPAAPKRTAPVVVVSPPLPAASAAPPPPVHEAAPAYHPPKFDAVLRMAN